ncbi:MAG: efflux RND transporter permease subunit, partial [Planctomycetota bacterium]
LRVEGDVEQAMDLINLPLKAGPSGRVVRLSDVATAKDTYQRWVTRARFNGRPCIHLRVDKESGGDLIEIADEVHDYVASVQDRLPPGVAVGTNSDLSIYVKNRLRVMADSGTIGAVLVLLALIAVLNARVAFMTALGIPISFLGGLVLAAALGVSMNMMTMFALIVVLGMIVDDAIVVGENGYRLMEEGMTPEEAAVEGTVQVGAPVVATILTSVSAFLPILVMTGVTGEFLRPLPLVVTFCLLVSMVEALVILPSHLAHWSEKRRERREAKQEEGSRFYDGLRAAYQRFLARCLHWRYVTLSVAVTTLVLLVTYAQSRVPFHLFDDFESKILSINMRTPAGTSLDETEKIAIEVETMP